MIQYTLTETDQDIQQILDLQQKNLSKALSQDEIMQQGFVTVEHDFELLKNMGLVYPHIIAKSEEKVIGYTLVMLKSFGSKIPILFSLFEKLEQLEYKNKKLSEFSYFVMGQVCIDKSYRGKGVFAGLYQKMQTVMKNDFDVIITEIATRNTRSMRAHEKVGFKIIYQYTSKEGEEWAIVGLDLK